MKKLLTLTLVLTLLFCVSCTPDGKTSDDVTDRHENTADSADVPEEQDNDADGTHEGFTVVFADGRSLELGADAASIETLGEWGDMFEAPSCVHDGYDRVYTYDGFTVTTSPDENGAEYVAEIALDSPSCSLDNGLTVGSPVDEMTAVYGDDYTDLFGFITYELEGTTASFVTDNGVITSIVFTYSK